MESTESARRGPRPTFEVAGEADGSFNGMQKSRFAISVKAWAAAFAAAHREPQGPAPRKLAREELGKWEEIFGALDSPLFGSSGGPRWPFDEVTNGLILQAKWKWQELREAERALVRAENHRGWGRARLDRWPYHERRNRAQEEALGARRALADRVLPPERGEFEAMAEAALAGAE